MTKVAAIQMCSTDNVDENLASAAFEIAKAADEGALLAVLPEMFVVFGQDSSLKIKIKETPGAGKIQDFIAELAIKHKIWIVAGTIPLSSANPNKVRAASIVFDHQGKQAARYDKISLFDVTLSSQEVYKESATTEPGSDVVVVKTPVGNLGLCVCFDLRFPHIFAKLAAKGAELIAAPAAFTQKTGEAHWKLLCRSRAIDTFCYIIGAAQGGVHANGRKTYGHSLIVDPWGQVLAELQNLGPGAVYADIDLKALHEIRSLIPLS